MGTKNNYAPCGHILKVIWFLPSFLFILIACTFQPSRPDPQSDNLPIFIAPTISVIQPVNEHLILLTPFNPTPMPTSSTNPPDCLDDLTFIDDLNYPDGENVSHGSIIQKQWLVQNTGTCAWTSGYTVRKIGGPDMGATPSQVLTSAVPSSQVTIAITFIAPTQSGKYEAKWQAYNPNGSPFGDYFTINIVVSQ
jgi:hypothetical protein